MFCHDRGPGCIFSQASSSQANDWHLEHPCCAPSLFLGMSSVLIHIIHSKTERETCVSVCVRLCMCTHVCAMYDCLSAHLSR